MKEIKNVAVIGGGLMGCGIAQVFASCGGLNVNIYDSFVPGEKIYQRIRSNLSMLVDKEVFTQYSADEIVSGIYTFDRLDAAVRDAGLIVECIPENMELKQNFFMELEPLCGREAIFATNTSVMSITEIAGKAANKERIVGTHFWNPPYLIPLVEVVKSDYTSDDVMDATMEILKRAGKKPIRVNRDVPGFVANRLQHALWREAISIVERGIADAATVDEAIKMSFGLRLPVLAPMENSDMIGNDLTLSIHSYILKHLESSTEPSPLLKEKVEKGELGFKTGKGFLEWTGEDMEESRRRLTEHLIKMVFNK
ncbi:3-hydroxyacyl-CoA dehydrogenase [Anaerobacterium chartisolvens]|uniref:3-hydroxyacyl-CoA dehydrogenase n=1 Tax=Anaerobacterium chartisolvens TaxID=1297424 RepID=A0A369AD96_9FIRM|nr:3-hydroxyacyl-CoA dehydrogenase NAD-binding domain-containing protein [Anaerobacterium chartisolvens]RCX07095.1 3-hydroxyacyl-CoA dehydrogenase [Anaerobacterium chartisolvens]